MSIEIEDVIIVLVFTVIGLLALWAKSKDNDDNHLNFS